MQGRERFGIFPPRVREINIRDMPLGFLARQFPVPVRGRTMRHGFMIGTRGAVAAMLAGVLAGCVPVTVNITFPQEQLDAAARTDRGQDGAAGVHSRARPAAGADPGRRPDGRRDAQDRHPVARGQ